MFSSNPNGPVIILITVMISQHHYIAAGICAHWSMISSLLFAKMPISFCHTPLPRNKEAIQAEHKLHSLQCSYTLAGNIGFIQLSFIHNGDRRQQSTRQLQLINQFMQFSGVLPPVFRYREPIRQHPPLEPFLRVTLTWHYSVCRQ